ncbi:DUF427 domain-containing protein [Streptomyces mayteni]
MSTARHTVTVTRGDQRIRVLIGGRVVAETDRPALLHETGLPVRYYVPHDDVDMSLFAPTETHTVCPFKGTASYWTFLGEDGPVTDVAWAYPEPLPEVASIAGHLCFYDTHADIEVVTD